MQAAIKQNPMALQYVPEECMSNALCLEAVTRKGQALRYIPTRLQSLEILQAAYRAQISEDGMILKSLPKTLKLDRDFYREICFLAVEQNPLALEFVPAEYKKERISLFMIFVQELFEKMALPCSLSLRRSKDIIEIYCT